MNRLNLNVFLLALVVMLSQCNIDKDRSVDRDKFSFATGDDTELFFKNVRQSDYDKEVNEASGFQVFRHRDRKTADTEPVLNLAIVLNIMQDEAYLFFEPSVPVSRQENIIVMVERVSSTADTLNLTTQNRESYLEFATQIYEGIQDGSTFKIKIDDDWMPLLADREEREVFRITTSDYYRLTRIY